MRTNKFLFKSFYFFLLIFLFSTYNLIFSQEIFEKTYGGSNFELGYAVDNTLDNGFIYGGASTSFTSSRDMFLIKLDSIGSIQWSKVYNSPGSFDCICGVAQTSNEEYYVSGYIEAGFGIVDHIIMRLNQDGNIIWAKNFGGSQSDELRRLSITSDGGVIAVGYTNSYGAGTKDVQVLKLFSDGTLDWAKTYGTVYEDFNGSCKITSDNNFVFGGAVDITGGYGIRPTIIKLDTLGNVIWTKFYSGTIEDWGRDIIETPDGGFLLAGDTRTYGYGGSQDIYLIKTDSDGNVNGDDGDKRMAGLAAKQVVLQ